jgi:hypothetical protein
MQILLSVESGPEGRLSGTIVTLDDGAPVSAGSTVARSFSGNLELLACLEDLLLRPTEPMHSGPIERNPS